MIHFLLVLLIVLAIVGLLLWGIGQVPGIPQIFKVIIYVIVGIILLLWLLSAVDSGSLALDLPHR